MGRMTQVAQYWAGVFDYVTMSSYIFISFGYIYTNRLCVTKLTRLETSQQMLGYIDTHMITPQITYKISQYQGASGRSSDS